MLRVCDMRVYDMKQGGLPSMWHETLHLCWESKVREMKQYKIDDYVKKSYAEVLKAWDEIVHILWVGFNQLSTFTECIEWSSNLNISPKSKQKLKIF